MSAAAPPPPRLAAALLRWVSPPGDAESIVGDLDEEYSGVHAGPPRSALWYWTQVLASVAPLLRRRMQLRRERRHLSTGEVPSMWQRFVEDVQSAARVSRRSPLTTAAVLLTITLGIGATAAVFGAANAILLKPLPFPQSSRVVELQGVLRDGTTFPQLAHPDLVDFRRGVGDFSALTIYSPDDVTLLHGGEPRLVHSVQVDGDYATVFSTHTALGRMIGAGDCEFGKPRVAVLSHAFWSSEFGRDPQIVGKSVVIDNDAYEVVGVLAERAYTYPAVDAAIIVPLVLTPGTYTSNRGAMWANAAALLASGRDVSHATSQLRLVTDRLAHDFPDANTGIGARILPLHDAVVGAVRPMIVLLSLTIAAVLLIASVNVGNLLLARAEARGREFAVRAALGGSPARLRRQVITESLLLASIGGTLGLLLAPFLVRGLVAAYPEALPRASEISIDLEVVAIGAVMICAAGLMAALPTARRVFNFDLARDLRDRSAGAGARGARRISRVLIVAQVAASVTLLVSAGLLLKTFRDLTRTRPGFDPSSTMTFHLSPSEARHPGAAGIANFYATLLDSLRRIPGVTAVAASSRLPFASGGSFDVWTQDELGDQGPGKNPSGAIAVVTPDFARALRLPLVAGRFFEATDDSTTPRVAVINDVAAKRYYRGTDPVGKYIGWGFGKSWRIVGVVATTHLSTMWEAPMPVLYAPASQSPRRGRYVAMRTIGAPDAVRRAAAAAVHAIDPTIALTDERTMEDRIAISLGAQRFRALLVSGLGALALVLAVMGLYGVVAYSVTQRTREIGIRIALGEGRLHVRSRVVAGAMQLAVAGAVIGIMLSLAAGRWLAAFLIGVSPHDGVVIGASTALLLVIVGVAADGPARRAARVDPMTALRHE